MQSTQSLSVDEALRILEEMSDSAETNAAIQVIRDYREAAERDLKAVRERHAAVSKLDTDEFPALDMGFYDMD